DTDYSSEEEVAPPVADVVPSTSRQHRVRTRVIARTQQSERVRETVNRNRLTTAQQIQNMPSSLTSSLLDETIEAVVAAAAAHQRPLTPQAPMRQEEQTGRRKKARKRTHKKSGKRPRRRKRPRKKKGKKVRAKKSSTARSRIAKALGIGKPAYGGLLPSMHKPSEPSLDMMRADIGVASLSVLGDPHELDFCESNGEFPANADSPVSARRVLSQSALRSHQPVARPVSMGLPRSSVPSLSPDQGAGAAPVPDLLGSILSGQTLLMMKSSDVVINRDGTLMAKTASLPRTPVNDSRADGDSGDNTQPSTVHSGTSASSPVAGPSVSMRLSTPTRPSSSSFYSSPSTSLIRTEPAANPAQATSEYSKILRPSQTRNTATVSGRGSVLDEMPRFNGNFASTQSFSNSVRYNLYSGSKAVAASRLLDPPLEIVDSSELPRTPTIQKQAGVEPEPTGSQSCDIPSCCITQLTGKETTKQPGQGGRVQSQKSNAKESQPETLTSGTSSSTNTGLYGGSLLVGTSRSKGLSSFESFKINIPGNAGHPSRLSSPGFCNTFRPVDDKVQQKDTPSPVFSVKKKQVKSEIYDPFEPTGSNSSSANSSPERLGSGVPLTNITRTISIESPEVQTFQTVRSFTPYVAENVFVSGADSDVSSSNTESHDDVTVESRIVEQISDTEERDNTDEEDFLSSPCTSSAVKQVSKAQCLKEERREGPNVFFNAEELIRPHINVKLAPARPSKNAEQKKVQKVEQAERRSHSRSSSPSKKMKRKKALVKEHKRSRSRSGGRARSSYRSSRSTSWSDEEYSRRYRLETKRERSTDSSSSYERPKKKKMKAKTKDKKAKTSRSREKRKHRSRSESSGSTSDSYGNRKKRRLSRSRSRHRERSRSNSTERAKRHKHRKGKTYERSDKNGSSRSRGRKRSRSRSQERRRGRSWSRSASRSRERKSSKTRENRCRSRSSSRERKRRSREPSFFPPPEMCQKLSAEDVSGCLEQPHSFRQEPNEELVLEELSLTVQPDVRLEKIRAETRAPPREGQETVKVEPICQEVTSETAFPLPEITNICVPVGNVGSSAEMELMTRSDPAVLGSTSNKNLEITVKIENTASGPSQMEPPPEKEVTVHAPAEAAPSQSSSKSEVTDYGMEVKEECLGSSEKTSHFTQPELQGPALRLKSPVKRVTWNLQEEGSGMLSAGKAARMPFYKLQRANEGDWKAEDLNQMLNQVQLNEPPPTNYMIPEPMFPDLDSSQVGSCSSTQVTSTYKMLSLPQVFCQNTPLMAPLPSCLPLYAPVSQPTVQFVVQGGLPTLGCMTGQSLTLEPVRLATASEPGIQAASAVNVEEKIKAPRPAVDKTKNEEYMKKLHIQERAVEEVKLAIKPFYQKREITKEEYKDILRKAVEKICHSRSGEINPVKVANLVKAYVEKYKHMRKYKKPDG
ncbi:PHD and RING finger domain-containing protein 1, partial [Eurypyga helias]